MFNLEALRFVLGLPKGVNAKAHYESLFITMMGCRRPHGAVPDEDGPKFSTQDVRDAGGEYTTVFWVDHDELRDTLDFDRETTEQPDDNGDPMSNLNVHNVVMHCDGGNLDMSVIVQDDGSLSIECGNRWALHRFSHTDARALANALTNVAEVAELITWASKFTPGAKVFYRHDVSIVSTDVAIGADRWEEIASYNNCPGVVLKVVVEDGDLPSYLDVELFDPHTSKRTVLEAWSYKAFDVRSE